MHKQKLQQSILMARDCMINSYRIKTYKIKKCIFNTLCNSYTAKIEANRAKNTTWEKIWRNKYAHGLFQIKRAIEMHKQPYDKHARGSEGRFYKNE